MDDFSGYYGPLVYCPELFASEGRGNMSVGEPAQVPQHGRGDYYTGVISGALLFIREDFAPLSAFTEGAIISFLVGAAVVVRLSEVD